MYVVVSGLLWIARDELRSSWEPNFISSVDLQKLDVLITEVYVHARRVYIYKFAEALKSHHFCFVTHFRKDGKILH